MYYVTTAVYHSTATNASFKSAEVKFSTDVFLKTKSKMRINIIIDVLGAKIYRRVTTLKQISDKQEKTRKHANTRDHGTIASRLRREFSLVLVRKAKQWREAQAQRHPGCTACHIGDHGKMAKVSPSWSLSLLYQWITLCSKECRVSECKTTSKEPAPDRKLLPNKFQVIKSVLFAYQREITAISHYTTLERSRIRD